MVADRIISGRQPPGAARWRRAGSLAAAWVTAVCHATAAHAASVTVTDDLGATVTLPAPARRIVSLAPHLTELLFAAGAGEYVVGTDDASDFPVAARRLPRVGSSSALDHERLVALRPDLVVAWGSGNPPRLLAHLQRLGVPVFRVEARRFDDVAASLRKLGQLAGTTPQAQARAEAFDNEVQALRTRYAGRTPLRTFHAIWMQPLMTINGEHLISQALELCGARNVFAGARALTPQVGAEDVLAADPDVVTMSTPAEGAAPAELPRSLQGLRAVRDGAVVAVNPDTLHRASDRIVHGARELCEKLDTVRQRRR
jgi:iron complex transport system substrate-binding protein